MKRLTSLEMSDYRRTNKPFDEQSAVDVYHSKLMSWLKSREAELLAKHKKYQGIGYPKTADCYQARLVEIRLVIDQLASMDADPELE